MEKALSVADLSVVCGVSKPVIYQALTSGDLRGQKVGRQWRVLPDEVKNYLRGGSGGNAERKPADPREAA